MKIYRVIGNEGRVTIPCVLRACVGFEPNDVVSFEMISKDTVLVRREQLVEQPVSCDGAEEAYSLEVMTHF